MRTPPAIALLIAALAGGCAAPMEPGASLPLAEAASAAGPAGCWHTVGHGETLRAIARHYYGSGRLWRSIQLANDVGQHPDEGRRLWIPGHLPELD